MKTCMLCGQTVVTNYYYTVEDCIKPLTYHIETHYVCKDCMMVAKELIREKLVEGRLIK